MKDESEKSFLIHPSPFILLRAWPEPSAPPTAPGQRGCHEMSGAAAETRSRVGRGADVPEPVDRGRVAARRGQWSPKQALVQLGGAAVRIAADGVGVAVAQVVRRQDVD